MTKKICHKASRFANAEIDIVFKALSQIGVLMIMFSSGLDTNIKEIKKNGLPSIVITVLGVVIPLVFGFFVGWGIDRKFAAFNSQSEVMHCIFFGIKKQNSDDCFCNCNIAIATAIYAYNN